MKEEEGGRRARRAGGASGPWLVWLATRTNLGDFSSSKCIWFTTLIVPLVYSTTK